MSWTTAKRPFFQIAVCMRGCRSVPYSRWRSQNQKATKRMMLTTRNVGM